MEELIIPESPYILGIDLGTSNSSAAIYKKGDAESLKVEGEQITIPSVIRFPERKKDKIQVGRSAKNYILVNPKEVFSSIKSLMKNDDWQKKSDLKSKFTIDGKLFTPTELAAEILKKIIETVQTKHDLDGEVREAVICVPANTTDEYRLNVLEAAAQAGLGQKDDKGEIIKDGKGRPKGIFLLEEPTAAAIAYGHELGFLSTQKEQNILVYDLGGGTFDVTILNIDSTSEKDLPKFTVKGKKGIAALGGDDLDKVLMELCAAKFKEETEIDIFNLVADQKATSRKELKNAQSKLKEEAEKAKIEMAAGGSRVEISINNFLKSGDDGILNLEVELRKTDFLEKIQPLLDKTINCVKSTLSEAKLTMDDINRVILVGGSTKADWIRNIIEEKLERKPFQAKQVDVIVSQGAAIYGALGNKLTDGEEKAEIIINETTSHHLGVELRGQKFGLVIPKNLPLDEENPSQKITKVFGNAANKDYVMITCWKTQKEIEIEEENIKGTHYITETDDEGNKLFECVGEFKLEGVPLAGAGKEKIEVTMEINKEGLLTVNAKVVTTGSDMELKVEKI